jgi:Heterokaryon incompatibility protein (HET)
MEKLYSRLNRDKHGGQEIRLFSLLPGTSNSHIRGSLFKIGTEHIVRDSPEVNYEALSYVWGDEEGQDPIFVNDSLFKVTRNLHAALSLLRLCDRERVLWIDAICINQMDYEERGHQVSLMRQIYESASQVLVWFGEAGMHGSDGMKELASLLNAKPPHPTALYFFTEGFSQSFRDILTRAWWSRVWVIQEAAVARRLTFLCGPHSLNLPNRPEELSELADALRNALSGVETLSIKGVCREHLLGLILNQRDRAFGTKSRLQNLVYNYLRCDCSDPRDRVFAFLGLSRTYDSIRNPPDYSTTIEAVAIRLLCHSARDIDKNYGCLTPDPETEANEESDTYQLERICKSLVSRNPGNRIFDASGSSLIDIKWHHVQDMPTYPVLPGIIVDAIATDDDPIQKSTSLHDLGTNSWERFLEGRSVGSSVNNSREHTRFRIICSVRGRQACVPRSALAGDKICIFLGFPCPFVLRQDDKTFSILGECCLTGVMNAEVVRFEEIHEIFIGDHWNWNHGLLRRQRRNAFSFSTRYNPTNQFRDHIWVAPGLEVQDIILNEWIGEQ